MEVEITGVGSELQGVGRGDDGRAVFVPGALPGERVDVKITREKPRFLEARLTCVTRSSPRRVKGACPYAQMCGGCAAMHMDYAYTLELKRKKVEDVLSRVGGFSQAEALNVVAMDPNVRTRNKAEYAISSGAIGLREADGHVVIEVEDCLLQHEASIAAMQAARAWLRTVKTRFEGYLVTRVTRSGEVMCVLSSDRPIDVKALAERLFADVRGMASFYRLQLNPRPAHALDGFCQWIEGEKTLTETLSGLSLRMSPQSFFQVNTAGAEALYSAALDAAHLTGNETVLDAYCGAGAITLMMARAAGRAVGVEIVAPAVGDARFNARVNALEGKTQFVLGDAARFVREQAGKGFRPDVLSVDPPRKGVDEALIEDARKAGIGRVIYVSCDPATLARDLKRLCAGGRYEVSTVQPVDMFPWTHHVEAVVGLSAT